MKSKQGTYEIVSSLQDKLDQLEEEYTKALIEKVNPNDLIKLKIEIEVHKGKIEALEEVLEVKK